MLFRSQFIIATGDMFKNLVKKVKSFAKKAAPFAGLALGAFGMNPGMAAGLGALIGGIGGGSKGAIAGGLGGYFGGKMFSPDAGGKALFGFGRDKFFAPSALTNI